MVLVPGGGVLLDELLQRFDRGEGDEIAGDEKLVIKAGGGVVHASFLFVGAKDEANGWLVAGLHHLILPVVEVKVHPVR